jgi:hypothetical protein
MSCADQIMVDPILLPRGQTLEVKAYIRDVTTGEPIDISDAAWVVKVRVGTEGGAALAEETMTKDEDDDGWFGIARFAPSDTALWAVGEYSIHVAVEFVGEDVTDVYRVRRGIVKVQKVIGGTL